MSAVERGIRAVPPVVRIAEREAVPRVRRIVRVLAVGELENSEFTGLVVFFHLSRRRHEAVLFGEGVYLAAPLDRLDEFDRLFHVLAGGDFAVNVQAAIKAPDGERSVLAAVVSQHDGVHIVVYEIVEIGIIRDVFILMLFLFRFESLDPLVTDGDDLEFAAASLFPEVRQRRSPFDSENSDSYIVHVFSPWGTAPFAVLSPLRAPTI